MKKSALRSKGSIWSPAPHVLASVTALFLCLFTSRAYAFWLLGFSSADTLAPGDMAVLAGTGGQFTRVGDPAKNNFTPFIPHAGFRIGVADGFDIGYRLTQVALPFSSVGPSLGGELDARYLLTSSDAPWQVSILGGMAYSYLQVSGDSKDAWSPGADLMVSHALDEKHTFISELRYVYTAIPSAPGGSSANYLSATGIDLGLKYGLTKTVSLVPEIGVFDFTGNLQGESANGIGVQYGLGVIFRL